MSKPLSLAIVGALAFVAATAGLLAVRVSQPPANTVPPRPVWTEAKWPFPIDQWGTGRAFNCKAADCGTEVKLYLRAKLGSCNCETGVADDADLDRMSDLILVASEVSPLGAGQPISISSMKGRSRAYTLSTPSRLGNSAISVAFSDRCDMIVATAVLPEDRAARIEPSVIEFLNSSPILRWVELALGI
jgi:hypothetical protein